MASVRPLVLFFNQIDREDASSVGVRAANLGEISSLDIPVAPGFVVTQESFERFLLSNDLSLEIDKLLKKVNLNEPEKLGKISEKIKDLIMSSHMPVEIHDEIERGYKRLSGKFRQASVVVRGNASFVGVRGVSNLLQKIKESWASAYSSEALYKGEPKVGGVMVQNVLAPVSSGEIISDKILIRAVFGDRQATDEGLAIPDEYKLDPESLDIISKEISEQKEGYLIRGNELKSYEINKKQTESDKICDEDILHLAKYASKIQDHFYFPQRIHWIKDRHDIFITGFSQITEEVKAAGAPHAKRVKVSGMPILVGVSAGRGIATGHTRIVKSPTDAKRVSLGDVLVMQDGKKEYLEAVKKASAVILEADGLASSLAILARDFGVPCITSAKGATKFLKEGRVVTVDADSGYVYLGSSILKIGPSKKSMQTAKHTATGIFAMINRPDETDHLKKFHPDGAILLAEQMILDIGVHPKEAIKRSEREAFSGKLAVGISRVCSYFGSKPVIYRFSDLNPEDTKDLVGDEHWNGGLRGAANFLANPDWLNLELQAVRGARERYKNLWVMLPFVRNVEEFKAIKRMIASAGLFETTTFRFWMSLDLPANLFDLEKFFDAGIDGVAIDVDVLSFFLSAQEAGGPTDSLLWAIKKSSKALGKKKISTAVYGRAPSVYEELVEKSVMYGITNIAVLAESIVRTQEVVARTEGNIIH